MIQTLPQARRRQLFRAKKHQKPHFPPGKGFKYTDTNYHLQGLIIEKITGTPFDVSMKQYIYQPLGMMNSSILHYSEPLDKDTQPAADFYVNNNNITNHKGYAGLDYTGGGVVSTGQDMLKFMKALSSQGYLLFRNYLRQNPEEAKRYSAFKLHSYNEGYRTLLAFSDQKSAFMQELLSRAKHGLDAW